MLINLDSNIEATKVALRNAKEKLHLLAQKLEYSKKDLEACQIRLPEGVEGTVPYRGAVS